MSVQGDLLRAIKATIESVTGLSGHEVRIRKKIEYRKRHDERPLILIMPETERIAAYHMPNAVHIDYPITVAAIDQNRMILEDVDVTPDVRQLIRRALYVTTFDAVSEVYDIVSYDPSPPFPPGAVDQAFDVSLQRFTYRAIETRNE